MLLGGAALVGGAGLAAVAGPVRAGAVEGSAPTVWAINTAGITVPHATWTKVPWPEVLINTTVADVDTDGASWLFPVPPQLEVYAFLCNIAWDNARGPGGVSITPVTHRKLARFVQQGTGADQTAYAGAATEVVYHTDLASRGDQHLLSDGTRGYQQQQVYVQGAVSPNHPPNRVWVEVYQDAGIPLVCRFDGSNAPPTQTRPRVVGLLAPSLMITKFQ